VVTHMEMWPYETLYREMIISILLISATLLQLLSDPCQAIIQDYNGLCQIIGIIKFGEKMSFSELIGKLKGELKLLVVFVEKFVKDVSRWKITDEGNWLEKFDARVKRSHESFNFLRAN
jgi:hypothetical protein